ncbi:hypothetical protein [Cobetia crustatorum]|uniref:Uncharacterized protein n=1 Tax=Cobetia crustatorum TaxID=553385 RepID=A0A558HG46_9GAMM|nr:hypothetical protein [Cobetia crustatorum]TVU68074.1 hypothetical protein FQP86_14885 [Cobetia crustatorum]
MFSYRFCSQGELASHLSHTNHCEGYVVYDVASDTEWAVFQSSDAAHKACEELNSLIDGKYQARPIYPDDGNINPVSWSVINTHFRDEEVATFESLQEAAAFSASRNNEAPT